MLNNPQVDQSRNRMDAGFQKAGNGDAAKMAATATGKRETEPSSSTRPRKAASPESQATTASKPPTHDEIAARAVQIYTKKGRPEGRDMENWLEAEAELHRERGIKSTKR